MDLKIRKSEKDNKVILHLNGVINTDTVNNILCQHSIFHINSLYSTASFLVLSDKNL